MQVNYCNIIPPMEIYPDDLRRIMVLLETVLFPTNTVDQFLMKGITDFMRGKLIDYETRQREQFKDMYVTTWTSVDGEACNLADESNTYESKTAVTVATDFPFATEEEQAEIEERVAKRVAKKRKAKK